MFIRGSVVRYVMLPRSEVDIGLLEDATRRGTWATTSPFPYSRGFWSQCLHESICRSREPGWKGPVISSPSHHPLCSLLLSSRSRCVASCVSGMSCLKQTTGRLRDVRGFGWWILRLESQSRRRMRSGGSVRPSVHGSTCGSLLE